MTGDLGTGRKQEICTDRCAKASSRMLPLVVLTLGLLEGETWERGLLVTRRWVSGDMRGALVPFGTARRLMAGAGAESSLLPVE